MEEVSGGDDGGFKSAEGFADGFESAEGADGLTAATGGGFGFGIIEDGVVWAKADGGRNWEKAGLCRSWPG